MVRKINKRGGLLNQVIVHVVLIGIILGLFLFATAGKINARGVRQQVLEKEIALLIDVAVPGMSFEISKENRDGLVSEVELSRGNIFITVDGLRSAKGYPYFSKYAVSVEEEDDKFIVRIR